MNISQLIASTERLKKGYGAKNTFGYKKFGDIYLYNKVVRVKPSFSIVEISMMIKAVSDKNAIVHKAMISIQGVKQESVSDKELIEKLVKAEKVEDPQTEEEKNDILKKVEEGNLRFSDQTIFKNKSGGYVIVNNEISKTCEIKVWCSCSSYYWVFQFYNVENGVDIWGKAPDKYIPKTKKGWEAFKSGKPLRNPGRNPGMCKHLLLLLAILMYDDTVAEARGVLGQYKANFEKFNKVERLSQEDYKTKVDEFTTGYKRQYKERKAARTSPGYMGTEGWEKSDVYVDGEWVPKVKANKIFNRNTGKFRWEKGR